MKRVSVFDGYSRNHAGLSGFALIFRFLWGCFRWARLDYTFANGFPVVAITYRTPIGAVPRG